MSENLGPGIAKIKALSLSGTFRQRLTKDHVKARGESIETWGLLQRIVVRKSDMLVICGEDRVAAHVLLDRDEIPCEFWSATDEEVRGMRAVENGHRRHSAEEQAKSLLEAEEAWQKVFDSDGHDDPKEAAAQQLAKERGVKVGTVERALRAAKKRTETPKPDAKMPLPVDFEAFGVKVDEDFCKQVCDVKTELAKADELCRQAQACVTRALAAGVPEPARLKRIAEEIHDAGSSLRDLMPACVCLWCKTLDEKCPACGGLNWNTAEKMRGAPAVLRNWEKPMVMAGGKIGPMGESPEVAAEEEIGDLL